MCDGCGRQREGEDQREGEREEDGQTQKEGGREKERKERVRGDRQSVIG